MRLLEPPNYYVTTMIDVYGLPPDFPGMRPANSSAVHARILELEEAFGLDIDRRRFIPYLQLHEFETLLLAHPEITNQRLHGSGHQLRRLNDILNSVDGQPEIINSGFSTSPSHRIREVYPACSTVVDDPDIAHTIGCAKLQERCPHFGQWVQALSGLSPLD